jgi:hypothetical protein
MLICPHKLLSVPSLRVVWSCPLPHGQLLVLSLLNRLLSAHNPEPRPKHGPARVLVVVVSSLGSSTYGQWHCLAAAGSKKGAPWRYLPKNGCKLVTA